MSNSKPIFRLLCDISCTLIVLFPKKILLDDIVGEGVIVEQTMAVEGHDGRRLSTPLDHHLPTTDLKSSRFAKCLYLSVCVFVWLSLVCVYIHLHWEIESYIKICF